MVKKYIVIKQLPDARVGTEVDWSDSEYCYKYKKSAFTSPNDTSYLTDFQVESNTEYFCKAESYPDYYSYKNPVFSRHDILELLKESSIGNRVTCNELYIFEQKLRELGKTNAQKILNKN